MTTYTRLNLPENLLYAWKKAKNLYKMTDTYVDQGELAQFELDLDRQLDRIAKRFRDGTYRLSPLRPLPCPKKIVDGQPIDRQFFYVAVADQVAWIALVNAVGPTLDARMPAWSYGHRLYRAAWYDDPEDRFSKLEIGPYRHASGYLYRKFQHSWPLYRRHISLTAKAMVRRLDRQELDRSDELAVATAEAESLLYLSAQFWNNDETKRQGTSLYYISLDLKNFYPTITRAQILRAFAQNMVENQESQQFHSLLTSMLKFRVDVSELPTDTIATVEPPFVKGRLDGIPTGLFVAGFLANIAMLPIDLQVSNRISRTRNIAHFRFVDDHCILAYNFDELSDWVQWYSSLIRENSSALEINEEKYDPKSFGEYAKVVISKNKHRRDEDMQQSHLENRAKHDAMVDGANPTKLLTKTLGQVSAIAATTANVLDDKDLEERFKLLEWLLLANIPEEEIRPVTRSAFAAGQIARLAPIMLREEESLVTLNRSIVELHGRRDSVDGSDSALETVIAEKEVELNKLHAVQSQAEDAWFSHCFSLLLQAFMEFPNKPRLFFRIVQFCRYTGYPGISRFAKWLKHTRLTGNYTWGDYYCGLSLQVLSESMLNAARTAMNVDDLRVNQQAALRHLHDIASIDTSIFSVASSRTAWFHRLASIDFSISAASVGQLFSKENNERDLGESLLRLAEQYNATSFASSSHEWCQSTGRSPSVWAHRLETYLSRSGRPSEPWVALEQGFDFLVIHDRHAARRYPTRLTDAAWNAILNSTNVLPETDSGWLRDTLEGSPNRIELARTSRRKAYRRAARNLSRIPDSHINVAEWTDFLRNECSPFDPRGSEWSALEILKSLVTPVLQQLSQSNKLNYVHPYNVLVPKEWMTQFDSHPNRSGMSWPEWRQFVREGHTASIPKCLPERDCIIDYRYCNFFASRPPRDKWENSITAVGRLLFGLISYDHNAPEIWNIRGNEKVQQFPFGTRIRSLGISSHTLALLRGCLGRRSIETRIIPQVPELFGWEIGRELNDITLDPPVLRNPNELFDILEKSQKALEKNQLAVSMNRPRQLIPCRLSDFALDFPQEQGD